MKLIIGGTAQGKLQYALRRYAPEKSVVWDGELPVGKAPEAATVIINHFHRWVRACMQNGGEPEREAVEFFGRTPDCIVISDEVGNGIVPVEKFEREYRERLGRILMDAAAGAEEVERVICGIGQRIK